MKTALTWKQHYHAFRRLGWSHEQASWRASAVALAEAGPCRCGHVRHMPGDDRCPASPTYTAPPTNEQMGRLSAICPPPPF